MPKERLDNLLMQRGLVDSREKGKALIMEGSVYTNGRLLDKPGEYISADTPLFLKEKLKYVSRGGLKLEKAVNEFGIWFTDKTVIDIGASTGGFTDVALQNDARKVYSIDVGKGQLHYSLTKRPAVVNLQKVNFRNIDFDTIGEPADLIVCDVSFISLKLIIPSCVQFCKSDTELIFLIKPQFEAERKNVGKNGVVKESAIHIQVIEKIIMFALEFGFQLSGLCKSPIRGPKGNVEYLVNFVYSDAISNNSSKLRNTIEQVVYD